MSLVLFYGWLRPHPPFLARVGPCGLGFRCHGWGLAKRPGVWPAAWPRAKRPSGRAVCDFESASGR
eukprot:8525334-Pyramimonas_sp.AAC.1